MARLKVGVLVSGGGTNLQALIDACAAPSFPAEIVLVISNKSNAFALERAAKAGIATEIVDHREFADRAAFDAALDSHLRARDVGLVCLAGFMRILSAGFVAAWNERLINIHPSLLPSFKGLDTHARAVAAGVRFAGCTVHFVRPEMDDGPIIVQAAVPVSPDDDADRLAARVLRAEHECYPLALRLIGEGRVRVGGGKVTITGADAPETVLFNPSIDEDRP